jgi:hypothetical protein
LDKLLETALHGKNNELLDKEEIQRFLGQKKNPTEGVNNLLSLATSLRK